MDSLNVRSVLLIARSSRARPTCAVTASLTQKKSAMTAMTSIRMHAAIIAAMHAVVTAWSGLMNNAMVGHSATLTVHSQRCAETVSSKVLNSVMMGMMTPVMDA